MDTTLLLIAGVVVITVLYLAFGRNKKKPKQPEQSGNTDGTIRIPDEVFGTKIPKIPTVSKDAVSKDPK